MEESFYPDGSFYSNWKAPDGTIVSAKYFDMPKLSPLDVYVCSLLNSSERSEMAQQVIARWREVEGINLTLLRPADSHSNWCPPEWRDLQIVNVGFANQFQRERRVYADKVSKQTGKPFYVVADDDCLVMKEIDVKECIDILKDHPQFAVLSVFPDNEKINEWTPDILQTGYQTQNDSVVMEHVSAGAIRFCRTGYPKRWPPLKGRSYDATHAEAIRKDGMRIGYFRYITHHHLGKGMSTVNGEQSATV